MEARGNRDQIVLATKVSVTCFVYEKLYVLNGRVLTTVYWGLGVREPANQE